jgi:hypothetical protein
MQSITLRTVTYSRSDDISWAYFFHRKVFVAMFDGCTIGPDVQVLSLLGDEKGLSSVSKGSGLPGCGPGLEPDRMVQSGLLKGKQGYPTGSGTG